MTVTDQDVLLDMLEFDPHCQVTIGYVGPGAGLLRWLPGGKWRKGCEEPAAAVLRCRHCAVADPVCFTHLRWLKTVGPVTCGHCGIEGVDGLDVFAIERLGGVR